ncbi:class I SAM-dependent methyltransferase [Flavobacteriaceae bacterium]|nr:class I SAM-dependent methyltransferase [Flavobacteriaceae bacterium]
MNNIDNSNFNKLSNASFDEAFQTAKSPNARVLLTDKNRQYYRFAEIFSNIDCLNSSILDVGCGNGEFLNYLNQNGFNGQYSGVDINKNLIDEARLRFPNQDFQITDILIEEVKQYDYVVMSGLFNLDLGQNIKFIHDFIEKMFELCKNKMIFNAVSTYVSFRDDKLYYLNPTDLVEFVCEELSPKFTLRHHFVPYNYTMSVYKDSNWESLEKS